MPNTNNQIQDLLNEFKAINEKARNYLSEVDKKIAQLDMKYAQSLVRYDINILKAAKSILLAKKK
ncbi:hypothetical protein KKA93_02450 [Patescibacteria group bacterium]|nr:hypothetical protein [Patescibacteria group bacterium]MBU1663667.1 hypothetical protein [Patescibacteria group bacterium]MBU1934146.1 hypothetical protein [Patescibacteria group bacterium]MBU2007577.1 hypothetical protein [Patescibacteria group bacterium]MBU2233552.1 hypothetical protein [Patescibacteria group bacterium]